MRGNLNGIIAPYLHRIVLFCIGKEALNDYANQPSLSFPLGCNQRSFGLPLSPISFISVKKLILTKAQSIKDYRAGAFYHHDSMESKGLISITLSQDVTPFIPRSLI